MAGMAKWGQSHIYQVPKYKDRESIARQSNIEICQTVAECTAVLCTKMARMAKWGHSNIYQEVFKHKLLYMDSNKDID